MKDWKEFTSDDWTKLFDQLLDYGSRVFAAVILLNPGTETVTRGGKSALDFVADVILDLLSGKLVWQPERGSLLNFLKLALRADIIDHLRSQVNRTESIEEFIDPESFQRAQISDAEADSIFERIREIVKDDIDLAKLVDVMLDSEVTKPRELALLMGVPVHEIYNLRRRLVRKVLKIPLR